MIEVRQRLRVARPPDEVFAYWGDHANNPEWQTGQRRCTWTTPPPIGVGSTYDQEASFLGRAIISSFEVIEFVPDRCIRIVTTKSSMPLDITREVAPTSDGGSELTAIIRGGPDGVGRLFEPLTRRMVARNVAKDYQRLAERLSST